MPMPKLLKRLSNKSLRKRTQSASSSSTDVQAEVPPVPPRSTTDPSFTYVAPNAIPNGSTLSVRTNGNSYLDKPSPPTPKSPSEPVPNGVFPPPPQLPMPTVAANGNGNAIPQDDFSKDMQAAWASATTAPKTSKVDKTLQIMENGIAGAMADEAKSNTIMTNIKTGLQAVGGLEAIENGINSFMEGMPVLMNALDEVAKLHPFIGVAVMAFKAVWALEQKRRDNDRKILALHMEMKEMMGVLLQLKSVQDADAVAPDGSTIKGRMQVIVMGTADDIKACSNACDTYSKKKLIVKVIKGPIWEGRLIKFVGAFTKRRSEFEFAMAAHTAVGVDEANRALKTVDQTTQEMNAKMDMMLKMFQQFVTPEQKEMDRQIQQRGGLAVLNNDKALKELNDYENKSNPQGTAAAHGGKTTRPSDWQDLKDDLHTDPDVAIEQNMTVFTRKFEIQKRQIIDELSRVVERQGDRIISAVNAGPHDKIIDPNVHIIWKEMGWRGSVKARHFVMALRDYFQEDHPKHADGDHDEHDHPTIVIDKEDEWALEYISVLRLQAISEAWDDDASGFVTVAEVNAFTTARPLDWSLPRWIAYWAVGQHQTMQLYTNKILLLLQKMFAILPNILPANKSSVNAYLEEVYEGVYTLVASVNPCSVNEQLQAKFKSFVEAEETRLRANLEAIQYDIDTSDTLELITGPGRIDRYLLPVFYLLLERHFEIFRLCQTRIVHPDELWDAVDTLQWVGDAVPVRVEELQTIFKQQKLDLKQQFKGFAFGLYEYMNEPNLLWDAKLVQEAEFPIYVYDDSMEAKDIDAEKITNYPLDREPLDFDAYAPPKPEPVDDAAPKALEAVAGMLGNWNGFLFWPTTGGMISMNLKPSSTQGEEIQLFTASARSNQSDFTIMGECRAGDEPGIVSFTWKRSFPARFPTQYFAGTWNVATDTLSGKYGLDEDPSTHGGSFVFKRLTLEHTCFVPSPSDLEANKPRALWAFAIGAVVYDIRKSRWSWAFFKERRDARKRFVEFHIRSTKKFGPPMTDDDWAEFARLKKTLTSADSRFIYSLAQNEIRATTEHGANCDNCEGNIGGARITCLVCQMKDTFNTVDFCSTPGCIDNRVLRDDMPKPHLPHHDLMKVQRVVHTRQFGETYRNAKEALKQARTFFKSSQAGAAGPEDSGSEADTEDETGHAPPSAKRLSRIPTLAVSIPSRRPTSVLLPLSAVSAAPSEVLSSGPACRVCTKPAVQPCWYCVQCGEESFICWDCDLKGAEVAKFGEHDFYTHDLVRVQELVEEHDLSVEERLGGLEDRFTKHEKAMDERLGRMEATVNGRMDKVEKLLEQLLLKLGAP
ncbi:hypothetical protein B0H16DRAFT_1721499 [Mycena metata]|uniref:Vacuolar protein sorting-associated protein 13 second N-terminal domain-containing protein n=1 Tax=Mycena metata TaxID=1033252 RepID=A0AAD7NEK5_9AGAR|nr:hypothetical protein B0H16DRAFT_1721499 [Mycena metata]